MFGLDLCPANVVLVVAVQYALTQPAACYTWSLVLCGRWVLSVLGLVRALWALGSPSPNLPLPGLFMTSLMFPPLASEGPARKPVRRGFWGPGRASASLGVVAEGCRWGSLVALEDLCPSPCPPTRVADPNWARFAQPHLPAAFAISLLWSGPRHLDRQ